MVSSDPSFASSPFRSARVKIFVEITAQPPPTNSGTKGEIAKKENKKKKSRHQFFFYGSKPLPQHFFYIVVVVVLCFSVARVQAKQSKAMQSNQASFFLFFLDRSHCLEALPNWVFTIGTSNIFLLFTATTLRLLKLNCFNVVLSRLLAIVLPPKKPTC